MVGSDDGVGGDGEIGGCADERVHHPASSLSSYLQCAVLTAFAVDGVPTALLSALSLAEALPPDDAVGSRPASEAAVVRRDAAAVLVHDAAAVGARDDAGVRGAPRQMGR